MWDVGRTGVTEAKSWEKMVSWSQGVRMGDQDDQRVS